MMSSFVRNFVKTTVIIGIISATLFSCNSTSEEQTTLPTSYKFTRDGSSSVSYSGQTERLDMLETIVAELKKANTVGVSLDETSLLNMYANENDPFEGVTYGKNLKSKTETSQQTVVDALISAAAKASMETTNATPGEKAGVYAEGSDDPTQAAGYLVDALGHEYTQLIEKGLMGSCFYFQAMDVYFSKERMNASVTDNDALEEGKNYTKMEHYFDEAFGYFGLPTDFDAENPENYRFWGKYLVARDQDTDVYGAPGIAKETFDAFVKGRHALVEKDYETMTAQINIIQDNWEKVSGLTAANYLNDALSSSGKPAYKKVHVLSEAEAFISALVYKGKDDSKLGPVTERLSDAAKVQATLDMLVGKNYFTLSDEAINAVITSLKEAFPNGEIK